MAARSPIATRTPAPSSAAPSSVAPHGGFRPAPEDLQLLAEIGLSAAVRGEGQRARPIFEALALWLPGHAAAAIGEALAALGQGRCGEAVRLLRTRGLTARRGVAEAKALLLVALWLNGERAIAQQLCRELLAGPDDVARRVAVSMQMRILGQG